MRLIVTAAPETVQTRLERAGLSSSVWNGTGATKPPPDKREASVWLYNGSTLPAIKDHDLLIYAATPIPDQLPDNAITVAWQDSPFASQYGFQLAAGGTIEMLKRAEDILDTLAPMPRGWLHAGGHLAPQFLSQLAQEVGSGLLGLATMIHTIPFATFHPLWVGQQQLQAKITTLAAAYLQNSQDEDYRPFHAQPPLFDFMSVPVSDTDSPARRLAHVLTWLSSHSNFSKPPQPSRQ
ncbi:hypothetical protein ACUHMQ_11360 [Chitinimonas sp. PSY-7]|uniref:hypothetical protein n=1 Tax=Chitinimonas sp. PSY-7 TaxID=3459088 RepID=UPI00403FEF4F